MYYEVYLDVVFIINFILDFIIVKITGCIAKRKSTLLRCITASIVSSLFLCVMYIFFMEILVKYFFIMMLIMNLITVVIAFCIKKTRACEIIRILAIYYAVSFILGGLINMICTNNSLTGVGMFNVSWRRVLTVGILVLSGVKPMLILIERFRVKESVYYDVELCVAEKTVVTKGLFDTGNHLVEPVSGKPVQVAELSAVEDIFEKEFVCSVKEYYEKGMVTDGLYLEKGIRMVPFRAVGTPKEKLLIAVAADIMRIKNKTSEYADRNVYIALYDGKLSGGEFYRVLLNSRGLSRERS